MQMTIIIGKQSNLSNLLSISLSNCVLISAREIRENIDILSKYKNTKINIIFNNFQQSTQLNNLESNSEYIINSILIIKRKTKAKTKRMFMFTTALQFNAHLIA